LVLIEGRLQTREWEGKDGQKRRTTEIVCERLQLGPRPMGSKASPEPVSSNKDSSIPTIDVTEEEIKAEDLPF